MLASESLSIRLIEDLPALESIRDEWSALLSKSEGNEPMLSPIWLINWWRVYGSQEGRKLRALEMRRDGRLVGLAPLCCRRVSVAGVPMQRLELLGSGENEADETCSEYIGIIAERGEEQSVADAFGQALRSGALGAWDELLLTALSSEIVMTPLLARALGKATHYEVIGGAPFALLPASWDAYLASLPSSRRYMIKRSLKAWEKWAKAPPKLRCVESVDELDAAFEMLVSLHAERWQEADHVGAFSSPLFSSFHRQTMRELLDAGALWLAWLEVEGEPVAAIYNLVWNNQVRFYQSGRKVGIPDKVRAGIVIHACAMQEAIRRGYTQYDFLAGTTRYKMQLSNNVRPLVELSLRPASIRSKIRDLGVTGLGLGCTVRNEWRSRFGGASSQ